jgi:hypothetical protein
VLSARHPIGIPYQISDYSSLSKSLSYSSTLSSHTHQHLFKKAVVQSNVFVVSKTGMVYWDEGDEISHSTNVNPHLLYALTTRFIAPTSTAINCALTAVCFLSYPKPKAIFLKTKEGMRMAAPNPKATHAAIMSPFPARSGASYSLSASWGIYKRNWIPHASTSPPL